MKTQIWILLFAVMFISCDFGKKTDGKQPEEEVIDTSEVVTLEDLGERYEFEGEIPEAEPMIEYGYPFEAIQADDSTYVFQGDIVLTDLDTVMQPLEEGQEPPRTAAARTKGFWPNNTVNYTISTGMNETSKGYIKSAIETLESLTYIDFVEGVTTTGYIQFTPATGCYSSIGRTGRAQIIGLSPGCSTGSVIHEIMHALGFWHEQSRSDRDKNLKIHWENITPGMEHNFKTYVEYGFDGQDIGNHDFGSIMHYPSGAFSKNGLPTITKLDGSKFVVNRSKPSQQDIDAINKLYPKPAEPTPTEPTPTPPAPEYVNGKYYTISGLTVLRYYNSWYWRGPYGMKAVELRNGVWYYK